jgi:superfamily II DNA or RNA helicase
MVLAAGGPVIYTINQEDLPTLKPLLVIVETPYTGYIDPNNYPEMLNKLTQNRTRNSLIVKTITREAAGHYTLVLSERIDHLAILKDMLTKVLLKMSIEILTRNIPKRKRLEIITKARNKQVDILLTTQLAREGLDLPHLDRLFLVTPKRAGNAVEQEIGRIKRPCQNKHDAVIFDFWDTRNPVFKAQFWKRQAVLDGCSWPKFIS